jgi:prolyl-tRNA editing enzyme YbaK/EbsC (Cys-tRNA(Pro) deacylase)
MIFGNLTFQPVAEAAEYVAESVKSRLELSMYMDDAYVAAIDPALADTAAFCAHYAIGLGVSANCVIVEAKRAEKVWYAACVILATTKADVNGVIRRHLDARKLSFAPMDAAVKMTRMEYGGITPIGLPDGWPVLIDEAVGRQEHVIIGSGVRGSKLLVKPSLLEAMPGAIVMKITK